MPQLCPPAVTARPAAAHTHTLGQPPPVHPPTSDTNPAPKLSPRAVPGACQASSHHSLPHTWRVHTPGAGSTCTSRRGEGRKASPAPSSSCRAPAPVFALLAEVRTEWAPLCCFPSGSHRAEPETWEEEKEGGRKGKPPLERGQQPRQLPPPRFTGGWEHQPGKARVGFAFTVSRALPSLSWLY